MDTNPSIQYIKGVGPGRSRLFERKGVTDLVSLVHFFPVRYEDRRRIIGIGSVRYGRKEVVVGEVYRASIKKARGRSIFEVIIRDDTGYLALVWFHFEYAYMVKRFRSGSRILAYGDIGSFGNMPRMIHPDIEEFDRTGDDTLSFGRIVPVYPALEGMSQRIVRKIMKVALDTHVGTLSEYLPEAVRRLYTLPGFSESIYGLHFPGDEVSVEALNQQTSPFHRRIKFDEFFFFEMALAIKKRQSRHRDGIVFSPSASGMMDAFEKGLPFSLTDDQRRVVGEISGDLASGYPMNRLLQGDVGSGKTVVALYAAVLAIGNHYQVAFMAPTEILAEQHLRTIGSLTRGMQVRSALLKSDTKPAERKRILGELSDGTLGLIVGTHALLQPEVRFRNCGLIVIDEQHRFGVVQRMELKKKGNNPHMLIMTATPIPRTLSMTAYGDLDISIIRQMPPHRKQVRTLLFYRKAQRQGIYDLLRQEMQKGRQVYVVYPLIEESDAIELLAATKMYEELKREFYGFRVELLHGKVRGEEREQRMADFKEGRISMLVATTVIEVGVDVPNATVMFIEHAERFGLSQLHQLRGRVGRGAEQSLCILYAHSLTAEAHKRLDAMVRTSDGFRIAEMDLEIRGPGEMLGIKQSGMPDFRMASIVRDIDILKTARDAAFDVVNGVVALDRSDKLMLYHHLRGYGSRAVSLIGV